MANLVYTTTIIALNFVYDSCEQHLDFASAQAICTQATTNKSTNWSLNLWKEWAENRKVCGHKHSDRLPNLMQINDLVKQMCQLILEVRQKDGNEYPPNTSYQICCGLLHHIKKYKSVINFFTQPKINETN